MSGLRCRPGDLAVVVGATMTPGLDGMFVIVERRSVDGEVVCGLQMSTLGFPSWVCRSAVTGALLPAATSTGRIDRVLQRHIADCILRPIRPNDGEDETLQWAGKPGVNVRFQATFDHELWEKAGNAPLREPTSEGSAHAA